MVLNSTTLDSRLVEAIRIIPDFPKPGISFKDIVPIMLDPALVRDCAVALAEPFKGLGVTRVIGIESRGFLLGPLLAQELNCGFVIVRKKGKLPGPNTEASYTLEYGSATIEMQRNAVHSGDRCLIHDDLLATGGTAAAAASLCRQHGADFVGFCFLVRLRGLKGEEKLQTFSEQIVSLKEYEF